MLLTAFRLYSLDEPCSNDVNAILSGEGEAEPSGGESKGEGEHEIPESASDADEDESDEDGAVTDETLEYISDGDLEADAAVNKRTGGSKTDVESGGGEHGGSSTSLAERNKGVDEGGQLTSTHTPVTDDSREASNSAQLSEDPGVSINIRQSYRVAEFSLTLPCRYRAPQFRRMSQQLLPMCHQDSEVPKNPRNMGVAISALFQRSAGMMP